MRYLTLIVLLFSSTLVSAQEYQKWTSVDGRTLDALFSGIDETQQTVVVLVPNDIAFSKLNILSIELARFLAEKAKMRSPTEKLSLRKEHWISSDGRSLNATFVKIDESAKTVSVLLTRTVPFSKLDPTSIEAARRLASERQTVGNRVAESELKSDKGLSALVIPGDVVKVTAKPWSNGSAVTVQGPFMVWGIRDFDWFDLPIDNSISPAEQTRLNDRFGVERVPEAAKGTIISRRRHPKSNVWVYQIAMSSKRLWILEGDLGIQLNENRDLITQATKKPNKLVSPNNEPVNTSDLDGRKAHIRKEYLKLMSFAKTDRFRKWGFAVGGPYSSWLVSILADRKRDAYKDYDGIAMSMALWQLGNEYLETKGDESKFTNMFRDRLAAYIAVDY